MITASMTSGEMRRVRNLDETRIYEFQMRKANELKREMKRQKVRQITKTFEFATPNADYFIVVGVKHGDVFASGVFIYLKETNEYLPMSRNEGYSEDDAWEFLNQNSKLKASGWHPYLCKVCSKWHIGRLHN